MAAVHPSSGRNGSMGLNAVAYPNWLACRNAAIGLVRAAAARGERPILLVASYAQQLEAQ